MKQKPEKQYCTAIYKHTCDHFVEWKVPQPPIPNVEDTQGFLLAYARIATQQFAAFPCPWCGGETGKNKAPKRIKEVSDGTLYAERLEPTDKRIGKVE